MTRDFKGVWIPREVWLDSRLSMLEKGILTEIDSLDSSEDGCWASNEYIAKFCQCSEWKVSTAITKLIDLGYLRILSFDGRTRKLKSCLGFSQRQTCEKPKADFGKPQASNIKNNTRNNTKSSLDDDDNPFGETDDTRPSFDTIEVYASSHLSVLGVRAMEELHSYVVDLSEDLVRHAIDNALDNGVRNWSYVKAILNSYAEAGVKTVGEAKAMDEKRKKGKASEESNQDARPFERMTPEERAQAMKSGPFGKWY